jgi:hypothetical protein
MGTIGYINTETATAPQSGAGGAPQRMTRSYDVLEVDEALNNVSRDVCRARTLWKCMEGSMIDLYQMEIKDKTGTTVGYHQLICTWYEDALDLLYILNDYLHSGDKELDALYGILGFDRSRT